MKAYIEMKKTIIKFPKIEIEKQRFYQHKGPTSTKNIDINKVVVPDKVSFAKERI